MSYLKREIKRLILSYTELTFPQDFQIFVAITIVLAGCSISFTATIASRRQTTITATNSNIKRNFLNDELSCNCSFFNQCWNFCSFFIKENASSTLFDSSKLLSFIFTQVNDNYYQHKDTCRIGFQIVLKEGITNNKEIVHFKI